MSLLTEAIVGLVATFSYWVQRIKSLSQINLQGLKLWKSQFSKSSIKACIFEVTFDSTGIPLSAVYRFGDKIHRRENTNYKRRESVQETGCPRFGQLLRSGKFISVRHFEHKLIRRGSPTFCKPDVLNSMSGGRGEGEK